MFKNRVECPERSRGAEIYMCFVYIIQNSINKLYIGVTKDPESRVKYHNQKRGASFTKYEPDFKLVFQEKYSTLTEARKREIQIKKWRRDKKGMLINRFRKGLPTKFISDS